jgi:ubiquinone/menaquinone biosynthesis C-methylase UbiE
VDHLLENGYTSLTLLDLSITALNEAKKRLGDRAELVRWIEGDVTNVSFDQSFDLWHDRAVFHFLTSSEDRKRYLATMTKSLEPDGKVIISTFSLDGPPKCSGLEIVRYDETTLARELGSNFRLLRSERRKHSTPWGAEQNFVSCVFERAT